MLRAGVDDCGSGPFKGYTCLVCTDLGATELKHTGLELLHSAGIPRFHGREFNSGCKQQLEAYEGFARAISTTLKQRGEYAAFQLVHQEIHKAVFEDFSGRVVGDVLTQFREQAPEFATAKAGALFSLARCLGEIPHHSGTVVAVELDQDQDGDELAGAASVGLAGDYGAVLTTASDALVSVANAYKRQLFRAGPSIDRLRVCSSTDSILIQAADLLANFGLAWVKSQLRCGSKSSERESVRARIFSEIVPVSPLPASCSLRVTEIGNLDGTIDDNLRFVLTAFPEG